ncbi:lycopene cyclase [Rhodococcus rhodnii]|nr:lycopene cyclase family protein [Rhodococcus rhodnii]TXG91123.1 lycopene cyclase [Rhodococcus rhodnii]
MTDDAATAPHSPGDRIADVAVVGLGPAGSALATRCAAHGLSVVGIDRGPDRRWSPTYGVWQRDLPEWLQRDAVATRAHPTVVTTRRVTTGRVTIHRRLDRTYAVLDTPRLQSLLRDGSYHIVTGEAASVGRDDVELADGTHVRATTVVDARGPEAGRRRAMQTAFGLVVPAARARPALGEADALFMDWRGDNGAAASAPPSFLYAVPLDAEHVLLEETCLVGRPALPIPELRTRLHARLAARGVRLDGTERTERVAFAVESPRARHTGFGVRAGMMHPGSGYSVGAALALADPYARALAHGRRPRSLPRPVQSLRDAGLRTLLELDPGELREFFDAFFATPHAVQADYLAPKASTAGTAAAMGHVFAHLTPATRRTVLRAVTGRTTDAQAGTD